MAETSTTAAPVIVRDGADASPLLGGLTVKWCDVFREEVLKKWLDPTDCALLARACWKCGEAVASAGLEYGQLEALQWARELDFQWGKMTCPLRCSVREPGGVGVGAGARLPVG
jgi:hypothetical protein